MSIIAWEGPVSWLAVEMAVQKIVLACGRVGRIDMVYNGRGMDMTKSCSPISRSQCCLFSTCAAVREIMLRSRPLCQAFTCGLLLAVQR